MNRWQHYSDVANAFAGTGTGAGIGMSAGAKFGPAGAGIGAAIGGVTSLIGGLADVSIQEKMRNETLSLT